MNTAYKKWVVLLLSVLLHLTTISGARLWIDSLERPSENDQLEDFADPGGQRQRSLAHINRMMEIMNDIDNEHDLYDRYIDGNQGSVLRISDREEPQIIRSRGKKAFSLFTHWKPFKARPAADLTSDAGSRSGLHGRSSRPLGQPLRWGRRR